MEFPADLTKIFDSTLYKFAHCLHNKCARKARRFLPDGFRYQNQFIGFANMQVSQMYTSEACSCGFIC